MVARGSAPNENLGTASDTAQRPSASHSSSYQTHGDDQSADGARGLIRSVRSFRLFDLLSRDGHSDSRRQHSLTSNLNESSETIVLNRPEDADRPEAANGLEHVAGHEYASGTRPPTRTSTANETQRLPLLPRLAVTNRFATQPVSAANRNNQRSLITASSGPALALHVTNTGQARVDPLGGVAPRPDSTATVRRDFSAERARTSRRDAVASDSAPANVVSPGRAGTSQTTGNGRNSDNAIIANGPLPAAGGAPTVGTMPAIGRDAYITVQSPDGRVSFPDHSSIGLFTN